MRQVKLGNTVLGDGRVKICLPLVGRNQWEIMEQLHVLLMHTPDVIEFRADWYENVLEKAKLHALLERIRQAAEGVPLLFTFRTQKEGGEQNVSWENYQELNLYVAEERLVDAVDVEVFFHYEALTGCLLSQELPKEQGLARLKQYSDPSGTGALIVQLQRHGVKVIGSNHDFEKTPCVEQMTARLAAIQRLGADVAKLAVMPGAPEDVLDLLCATRNAAQVSEVPLITMAMGRLGALTRMGGGLFGSALTFASAGRTSAPGQIEIEQLRAVLALL